MRSILSVIIVILAGLLLFSSIAFGADYNSRFVKNYPPGFNGMYYYAERFFDKTPAPRSEEYRWDKFTSRLNNISYPFLPQPYPWDYGNGRTFSLPDYNANNW
ncbi:MAG: hypothetical protein HY912_17135 [Desulfomonile tiedjei]|uniref:Uncharacterized protein n=1 Tax=Desulfomonile tiedjei TaxID=2358 RepID=A0A9D6V754_9BACT|nr:hypothetical protein [Desulfomonile tiedjei]